ncbi:SDR family NAD(P)-dependent oxidoreductase [Glaciecola sp. KUL10]|uniref:SDR family NAD(P)-dependent oxidoreductase n=1 Tax=Glaciecola sp. (strain KUL10) TaxID=2161813 RepID=UPI000D78B2F9|nr:SDR family oxidoreductase [Glaciecola sp. KUL10]
MTKAMIITGGSSGIGESIAAAFEKAQYEVFNLDIQSGTYGTHIQCDVTQQQSIVDAVHQISRRHQIDTIISNAGIHFSADIENTSAEDFERILAINVKGAFYLTQACIPFMKEKGGSIIYIASEQALVAKANSFAYNLSKHALASIAKTTALDYAKYNIRANAICPGTIETPLYHNAIDRYCEISGADKQAVHQEEASLQPIGRLGQPEEVAAYALFLAGSTASFITGSLQVIDGGYTTG